MLKHWSVTCYILLTLLCIYTIYTYIAYSEEGFSSYTLPKIIWSYWHDPNIPPKLNDILTQRKEVLSDWKHYLLNEETIFDYIPRSAFPRGYSTLIHQHKADWIRLYLLKVYGGCWMDASIIVNRPDEINTLYRKSLAVESQLSGYSNGDSFYIETFLILAPLDSPVIKVWLTEYTSAIELGFLSYKKKVMSKIDVSNCFNSEDDVYLTTSAALQYTLQVILPEEPPMVLNHRNESMYKYLDECNHDSKCVIEKINNTPKHLQPPNIKLTRFTRTF